MMNGLLEKSEWEVGITISDRKLCNLWYTIWYHTPCPNWKRTNSFDQESGENQQWSRITN